MLFVRSEMAQPVVGAYVHCTVVSPGSDLSDGEWEELEEEEQRPTTCLLCPAELPSPVDALQHCADEHHFSLSGLKKQFGTCMPCPPVMSAASPLSTETLPRVHVSCNNAVVSPTAHDKDSVGRCCMLSGSSSHNDTT